ncbi:MAG: hypothetical protein L0206_25700, partial [Actinobacteria bacterium]|nr:hypothetical protein [Actinomycetota bacterium]
LDGGGSAEFSVIPTVNDLTGPTSTCTVECVPVVFSPPAELACADAGGGRVDVVWTNPQVYAAIELTLDGVVIDTLPGDAEAATVTLEDLELHEICVDAIAECAPDGTDACCEIQVAEIGTPFLRGDINGNGVVFALVDALYLLDWAFTEGDDPPCMDAADVNDNGVVFALVDALALLDWAFTEGDDPPDPGPTSCGTDPTDDSVDCDTVSGACD